MRGERRAQMKAVPIVAALVLVAACGEPGQSRRDGRESIGRAASLRLYGQPELLCFTNVDGICASVDACDPANPYCWGIT
jgi:hypothetical protein